VVFIPEDHSNTQQFLAERLDRRSEELLVVPVLPRRLSCNRTYLTTFSVPTGDALAAVHAGHVPSARVDLLNHSLANNGRFYVLGALAAAGVETAMYFDTDALIEGRLDLAFALLETAAPGIVLGVVREIERAKFGPRGKEAAHLGWTDEQAFNAGVLAFRTSAAAAFGLPDRMASFIRQHLDPQTGPLWHQSTNQAPLELATINRTFSLPGAFNCRAAELLRDPTCTVWHLGGMARTKARKIHGWIGNHTLGCSTSSPRRARDTWANVTK
jgi:hypothetical protein